MLKTVRIAALVACISVTALALWRPTPIIILAAIIAWLTWAAFTIPRALSLRDPQFAMGLAFLVAGAFGSAWAFNTAFGQSMAPGRPADPKYLVAFFTGLIVMGSGIFAIATRKR